MIPLEAIEAAAHRLALEAWGGWEFVPNTIRTQFLRDAYLALEAAAPYLVAQAQAKAWDEGQKSGMRHADRVIAADGIGRPDLPGAPSPNPYRAADIRAGA